jgi:hypothetical protein
MKHATTSPDLGYYREPAPMTAIDEASHGWALAGLGAEPDSLAEAVRGVLIHRDWAPQLNVQLSDVRLADQHIRPVNQVLDRIIELRDEPISVARPLADRMVGVCRHYAVLYAALLRRHGVPARARAGFGRYFGNGWCDHWVTERWDGRWVRDDAQIGQLARAALKLDFDPSDQPEGEFLTGAEAWLLCRAGDADPDDFGIFDEHGLWFVLGDLMLDLAAINKVELLPWDSWGTSGGPGWKPTSTELDEIDRLASVIVHDDGTEIRDCYVRRRVPSQIRTFVGGTVRPVELGELVTVP